MKKFIIYVLVLVGLYFMFATLIDMSVKVGAKYMYYDTRDKLSLLKGGG